MTCEPALDVADLIVEAHQLTIEVTVATPACGLTLGSSTACDEVIVVFISTLQAVSGQYALAQLSIACVELVHKVVHIQLYESLGESEGHVEEEVG